MAFRMDFHNKQKKTKVNTAMNDNSDLLNSASDETIWKESIQFTFGGPLKRGLGEKSRDRCNTLELTADEAKKLESYYTILETYVKEVRWPFLFVRLEKAY